MTIAAVHKNLVGNPEGIPRDFADAFNAIVDTHAPHIVERAEVKPHHSQSPYSGHEDNSVYIELPYNAIVNSDVLEEASQNRAFQGFLKMVRSPQNSIVLPEVVERITGTKRGGDDTAHWHLNADARRNICQFELPISDTIWADKAIVAINGDIEKRLGEVTSEVRDNMKSKLAEDPIRIERGRIILPATSVEDFGDTIQQSNHALKRAIANATQGNKTINADQSSDSPGR